MFQIWYQYSPNPIDYKFQSNNKHFYTWFGKVVHSFFSKHSVFFGVRPSMLMIFLVWVFYYASDMLKWIGSVVSYDLLHHQGVEGYQDGTNYETAIQWCSLKYNCALKSHFKVKLYINKILLFCKHNGVF